MFVLENRKILRNKVRKQVGNRKLGRAWKLLKREQYLQFINGLDHQHKRIKNTEVFRLNGKNIKGKDYKKLLEEQIKELKQHVDKTYPG